MDALFVDYFMTQPFTAMLNDITVMIMYERWRKSSETNHVISHLYWLRKPW